MSNPNEVLQYVRRVILKHKVRQFALKELCEHFQCNMFKAKAIYFAVVHGCNSGTVLKLSCYTDEQVKTWVEGREADNAVKGL